MNPRLAASRVASATSRDLPTPASPLTSATTGAARLGVIEQPEQTADFVVPPDHAAR